jgi:small GTP-binding protein
VTINEENVVLELWDTVGQEEYRSLTQIFVKNSKIVIFVYDVTSLKSFESLNFWYDYVKNDIGKSTVLGVVGSKTDLIFEDNYSEEVSPEKGKEFAMKIGANFSLVSAKESCKEIVSLFNELASKYLNIMDLDLSTNTTIRLETREKNTEKKKECCLGKSKKTILLKMIFLGCKGVGKTSIIKAIQGNNNVKFIPHTKASYTEKIHYNKHGQEITVELKDTNWEVYCNGNLENEINDYNVIFLVFNLNKKETFDPLKDLLKKIDTSKHRIYLLAYNKESFGGRVSNISEVDYGKELQKFILDYNLEYEYITIDDIYKLKAIILDNIRYYTKTTKTK